MFTTIRKCESWFFRKDEPVLKIERDRLILKFDSYKEILNKYY